MEDSRTDTCDGTHDGSDDEERAGETFVGTDADADAEKTGRVQHRASTDTLSLATPSPHSETEAANAASLAAELVRLQLSEAQQSLRQSDDRARFLTKRNAELEQRVHDLTQLLLRRDNSDWAKTRSPGHIADTMLPDSVPFITDKARFNSMHSMRSSSMVSLASSTRSAFAQRSSSARAAKGLEVVSMSISAIYNHLLVLSSYVTFSQTERIHLFADKDFVDSICHALVLFPQMPSLDQCFDDPRLAHFPSHLAGTVLQSQLDLGLLVELHSLAFSFLKAIETVIRKSVDTAAYVFWISNVHQLLCIVDTMFKKESLKQNSLSNLVVLSRIQDAMYVLLEEKLLPSLLNAVCEEVSGMAAPAILGTTVQSFNLWGMFTSTPDSGLFVLNTFLSTVGRALKVYGVPHTLYSLVMMKMLSTIGSSTYNTLLASKNFLSPERGALIESNISTVIEWYTAVELYDTWQCVEPLCQVVRVCQMPKTLPLDVNLVLANAHHIPAADLYHLFSVCYVQHSKKEALQMSPEFEEALKVHCKMHKEGKPSDESQSDKGSSLHEEAVLGMEPIECCSKFVPEFVELPLGYQSILFGH
ncbi:hypothetical protein BC830DRAFT_1173797 [Chytriomyces sp. MP71]|nr:hypothetical protein BC830DRAFT_1173797 [Chytriomyces sp. MP71]